MVELGVAYTFIFIAAVAGYCIGLLVHKGIKQAFDAIDGKDD